MREEWFIAKQSCGILKYPWADKTCKEGEMVLSKYVDAMKKSKIKAKEEFTSFLHQKYLNDML